MQNILSITTLAILLLLSGVSAQAQTSETKKDIIFRAINDELTRTMTELNHPEAGKPFFAGFYFTEGIYMSSNATLGAILSSGERKIASASYRLMFGSYEMNDENFEQSQDNEMVFPRNIADPIECDYAGIRRVLWNMADHSYKSASRNYVAKKAYYAKNPKLVPDFPDYLKQNPVTMEMPEIKVDVNRAQADSLVRALSYQFAQYPEIKNSSVDFSLIQANLYLINTEGTRLFIPYYFAEISVNASIETDKGESIGESFSMVSMNPSELLHDKSMAVSLHTFAKYLSEVSKATKLDDEYEGPVLYTGGTAASKLMGSLFSGKDALVASRDEVENTPAYRKQEPKTNTGVESKLGKRFMPTAFSVVVKPKLETYNGVKLFGKAMVDYEGTIPPDELVLVENGILKDLLRNRIPTSKAVTASNGHNLINVSPGGIYSSVAPGVFFFTSAESVATAELKKTLLKQASDKGLEYAIVLKPLLGSTFNSPSVYYKVSVADGSETLIRPLSISIDGGKTLNHIAGCSTDQVVINSLRGSFYGGYEGDDYFGGSISGTPTSAIIPDAMLFTDMKAESTSNSVNKSLLPEMEEE